MAILDLRRLTRSAFVFCLGLFVLALTPPAAVRAETAIHFTLGRKIDGPAAPFFLAIDKGYFKAEGLDVIIDAAPGGPLDAINRLATGSHDMGVSDINLLIKARDAAATPVKAVFAVFDRPAYAVIARRSRGIVAPGDLEGRKLGAPAAEPGSALWPLFAKINNVDLAKVTVENVGAPVRDPMLAAGEVDAIIGCSFTSYLDLTARGVPADDLLVMLMADHGVMLYGDAIMAADKFAQQRPEAVRAFLRAYLRALQDTVRDPARAVEAVLSRSEDAKRDVELERLRMAIRDNIVTVAAKAAGYGGVDPKRFAAAIDQIALTYRFKARDKAADAFDPSFLPPAAERRVGELGPR